MTSPVTQKLVISTDHAANMAQTGNNGYLQFRRDIGLQCIFM